MKNIAVVFVLFLLSLSSYDIQAQQTASCSRAARIQSQAQIEAQVWPVRALDVQSYKLLLDWRPIFKNKNQSFSGVNEIVLLTTAPTDTILLDATQMRIDSLWINGIIQPNPPQPDSLEHLAIKLSKSAAAGDHISLRIGYTRTSATNDGMWFFPKGYFAGINFFTSTNDSVFVEEDLAYTMSEAQDAHKWMPCVDLPYDKAMSEISIIVPNGVTAQSNGNLDSITSNKDGSQTFHWKSDKPMSTYLMVADASKWVEWKDYYHRVSAPGDSVLVNYFAWKADYDQTAVTDGSKYNAQISLHNTPLMIKAFSERFGEYPFNSYGQVPVQPFLYGGMEHQTMTTLEREVFRGYEENLIAHELMHQWFGDKTTCESWSDSWLNESFATFGEDIWTEAQSGSLAYTTAIKYHRDNFFSASSENIFPIYDPPFKAIMDIFTIHSITTYTKGGLILHTLRRMLGNDTMFFHALRDYSNAFAYTTANTAQLQNFLTGRLGMDMAPFFNEWIYGKKWPVYGVKWAQNKDNALTIRIVQTQGSPAVQIFHTPVHLIEYPHGGSPDTIILPVSERDQYYHMSATAVLDSLVFDQDAIPVSNYKVTLTPALGAPELGVSVSDFTIRYEPSNVILSWNLPESGAGTIQIFDLLGRVVREIRTEGAISHAIINTNDLSSGSYLARLASHGTLRNLRFLVTH